MGGLPYVHTSQYYMVNAYKKLMARLAPLGEFDTQCLDACPV